MRTPALLLLLACAARAQESLVERLEAELRALLQNTDRTAGGAVVTAAGGRAVLVGTPPRVVAPYATIGDAVRVRVRLADRREVTATRLDGDPDLGVVVLKLPDEVAKELKGVDVEGDWARLSAGSIAIATEGRGRGGGKVGLVALADPRLGMIDSPLDGAAVFGSRGTLIGLRGELSAASCAACHQAGTDYARTPWRHRLDPSGMHDLPFTSAALYDLARSEYHLVVSPLDGRARAQDAGHLIAGPVIRRVLEEIDKHGSIQHAFMGVVVGDIPGQRAVQVASVVDGSPAFVAGLGPGMRIEAMDGLPCPSALFFSRFMALRRPGEEVVLRIAGEEVRVRLGDRAAARAGVVGLEAVGLTGADLGEEVRRFLGYPPDLRGVVVQEVKPDGPAAAAGIRKGDVITEGGGGAVADLEELKAALAGARGTIELSGVRIAENWGNRAPSPWTAKLAVPEARDR